MRHVGEVTGQSSTTVDFDISPILFDADWDEQEQDMQEFRRDIFNDLHTQLKNCLVLVSVHF